MRRRDFIKTIERAAAGVVCMGLPPFAAACAGFRYVPYTQADRRLVVRRADFGDGSYALLDNPQLPRAIYVHRHPDGSFSAVLTRCSHQGCQVEPAGERLACPCHGSEYSVTGDVLQGPAERSLYRYEVSADADHIYIELPDPSVL